MVRKNQTQQTRTLNLLLPLNQVSFEQEASENPVVQEVIRVFDAKIAAIAQLLSNDQVQRMKKV